MAGATAALLSYESHFVCQWECLANRKYPDKPAKPIGVSPTGALFGMQSTIVWPEQLFPRADSNMGTSLRRMAILPIGTSALALFLLLVEKAHGRTNDESL